MDVYGLIGKSLPHTKSPEFFNNRFKKEGVDAEYRIFEINNIIEIDRILSIPKLKGLNITVPYKQSINHLIDVPSPAVKQTGSANLLTFNYHNNKRIVSAFNTDVDGFEESIKPYLENNSDIKALIIGTGGTAHTASYVLRKLGISYYYISRNPSKSEHLAYDELTSDIMKNFKLIVNCTPLGMYPKVETFPDIPFEFIDSKNILFDCVYNPENTVFLKRARSNGAQTISGKKMFEVQAEKNWDIWFGK